MISFKQFYEEFRVGNNPDDQIAAEMLGVYKNPSTVELSLLPADARGFILDNGDFYVGNIAKSSDALHNALIKRAAELYKMPPVKKLMADKHKNKSILTMVRVGYTKGFGLGESEPFGDDYYDSPIEEVKHFLKAAKKKNRPIVFFLKPVNKI